MSNQIHLATNLKVVKTACRMCNVNCGINVYVRDGKIVKVKGMPEHPLNHGVICPKGLTIKEYVYSPDRLKHPMKKKEDGTWERISWDEALDIIASKLKEIREMYGARAVSIYTGEGIGYQERKWLAQRFCDVYGTPNFTHDSSVCWAAGAMGCFLTYGRMTFPDYKNANCIVIWGSAPSASKPHDVKLLLKAKERGAKLITIDPRSTYFSKRADFHARIRPGTDCALALGMMNVIISEGLYDREFVEKWTAGFDKLVELVKHYSPEKVEEITMVPAPMIRRIAHAYATNKPACIYPGEAPAHHNNAVQTFRAICILEAMTGNIDVPGGNVLSTRLPLASLRLPEKVKEKPVGAIEHPLYYEFFREGHAMVLPETILTSKPYPVKFLIVSGANPALTWPNSGKVRKALGSLDFLVVIDVFMTETAKLANVVLPATTFLERTDFRDYGALDLKSSVPFYCMLQKKSIEPLYECWPDWKIWFELARKMGFEEYFQWKDVEEVIDFELKPVGFTVDHLKKSPKGLYYGSLRYKRYEKDGFETPSGKIELYSQRLEDLGYHPLPVHKEPEESPISSPILAKEYPLVLTTGARIPEFVHSQLRNISKLRNAVPEPWLEIHLDTATKLEIEDGDMTIVESKRGCVTIRAKVTKDIIQGVVQIPHGHGYGDANVLTDDKARDPISGFPAFRSLLCKVTKVKDIKCQKGMKARKGYL